MRIAALVSPRRFEIQEVSTPPVAPDAVLVKVVASGVCASELEAWVDGPTDGEPRYLGHEVGGIVVETGPEVTGLTVGDRVGVWVTEQGFAEHVAVRADHCFRAGDVPLTEALAEPLACAVNAVEAAGVRLGDDVVLIGAGFMGHLVHKLVALRGVRRLVVADTRPDALRRASRLGATRVVDVSRESLAEVVGELTEGRGADLTFECTGTQAALTAAGTTTRMSGAIVLVGFHQGADRSVPLAWWNWMAFRIVNGHFRERGTIMRGMDVGMRLVRSRTLSMAELVTHRFPLERVDEAFATLESKPDGFVKAVVTFPES